MGWEHLFAGWLAGIIVENKEKKKVQRTQSSSRNSFSSNSSGRLTTDATKERIFISSRNKIVVQTYKPVKMEWFDDFFSIENSLSCLVLTADQIEKLRYFYARITANPQSIEARIDVINYWLKLWKEDNLPVYIDSLQNELVYLIDYITPKTKQEQMYRHLAMFISSECYFFVGDFTNALKRLYQVLDWQDIYDNAEDKDGLDFNGLSSFHEAVLANIINLYAMVGLPEKADAVRNYCSPVITEAQKSYAALLSDFRNDTRMLDYLNASAGALRAKDKFSAYYLLFHDWYSNDVFTESVISVIRGQPIFGIQMRLVPPEDISYQDVYGLFDGDLDTFPGLCFRSCGNIVNWKVCAERCKADMKSV